MSDNEISMETGEDLDELRQQATRRRGRGFTDKQQSSGSGGAYDTLKGDGVGPQRSIDGWTIFVSGINEEVIEDDMMEKLQEYGKVLNMHLNLDRRTGYLKGYCVAQYETKEEAQAAIEGLDGSEFIEKTLSADWAFVNSSKRR
ncbi:unnamed protein product [Bursaphelenchus okinawaensis]|uniref:RNA-binding protein 8A n=1 Tax=Bursaphelenchus okinawaensis TaxID=465554 RepID=A0A811LNP6_9BILA|nr:unnamed protein product [Bursaphelenchus okinawaensis]CAG9126521.1 unnamed protein product [Bursaphelenchus okinawaensis]